MKTRVSQQGPDLVFVVDATVFMWRDAPQWSELRETISAAVCERDGTETTTLGKIVAYMVENCRELERAKICARHDIAHVESSVCPECRYERAYNDLLADGYSAQDAHVEAALGDGPAD